MLLNKILKTYAVLLGIGQVKHTFLVRIFKKQAGLFAFEKMVAIKFLPKSDLIHALHLFSTISSLNDVINSFGRICVDAFYCVFMSWD